MTTAEKINFLKESKELREKYIKESKTVEEVELLKEMVKITKEVYGNTSNLTVDILNELGGTAKYIGDYDIAISSLNEARKIIEDKFGKDCIPYATTTLNLTEVYRFKGDLTYLEDLYKSVIKIYDENDMKETYEYAGVCNNLGLYYQDTDQMEKALNLHEISYEILKKLDKWPIALATTLNNMAIAYRSLNQVEKSDECIKTALKMYEKEVGKGHSMYSAALNNLAISLFKKGDLEKSLELFEKGLFICEASFGKESINYIKMKENVDMVKETIEMSKR